ncbi:MAG: alpha/beta hydrolase [Pseudomonadota bacterium]
MKTLIILAVGVAIIFGVTLWRAAQREAAAVQTFPPEGQLIEVEGRTVHVVIQGDGPDVVLIHGSSGNTRDFTFDYAGDLAATGYRVLTMDRAGLGHSDPLPPEATSIFDQARLLQAAAAQLGADAPIVVGQSYGGSVALAWAVDMPDRLSAVVSLAGASQVWEGPAPALYRTIRTPVVGELFLPFLTAWVPDSYVQSSIEGIFAPQEAIPGYGEYVGAPLSITRSALRSTASQRVTLKSEIASMVPRYPDIAVPIELVHGDADTIVPLQIHAGPFKEQVPAATLTVLPGVGHMPQHVSQDAVTAAIDRAAVAAGLK